MLIALITENYYKSINNTSICPITIKQQSINNNINMI